MAAYFRCAQHGEPAFVIDRVGGDFLPNNWWCPWSSSVVAEIRP